MTPTKRCTKCGNEYPATQEYFSPLKQGKHELLAECKECHRLRARLYREMNPDKARESSRRWKRANQDKTRRIVSNWQRANPEKRREYCRRWREANPEKNAANARNYRARSFGAEGFHATADISAQYERQKGRCYYCKCELNKKFHVDHIVPLSRGGTNWPDNLVCACERCNKSKQDKLPHEWAQGGKLL